MFRTVILTHQHLHSYLTHLFFQGWPEKQANYNEKIQGKILGMTEMHDMKRKTIAQNQIKLYLTFLTF